LKKKSNPSLVQRPYPQQKKYIKDMDVLNQTEQVQLKAPSSSHINKDETKLDLYASENLIVTQEDDEELTKQQQQQQQQPSKRKYRSSMSDAEADAVDQHNDLEPNASSNNHFDEIKNENETDGGGGESALINNNKQNNNNNDTMLEQDELDVNVNINEDQCLGGADDEEEEEDYNNNNNNHHHHHDEEDDEPPPRPGDEEEGLYDDVMGASTLNISASDSLLQAAASTTGAIHSASTANNLANTSAGSINTKQLVNNTSGSGSGSGVGYTKRVSCYIGNLTWWTTDKDLHEVIVNSLQVTDLLEIKFYENKINGQSKGFCLCTVGSDASFRLIMDKLPKLEVNGQMPLCTHFSRHFFNQFEEQARKDMASAAGGGGGGGNQANGSQMDHQYHNNGTNNSASSMHHHHHHNHNHHANHHNQGNNFGNQSMSGGGGGGPQGGGPQQQFMSMLFKLMFKNNNFIIFLLKFVLYLFYF
jgi:hypothetical protein